MLGVALTTTSAFAGFSLKKALNTVPGVSVTSGQGGYGSSKSTGDKGYDKARDFGKELDKYLYTNFHGKPYEDTIKKVAEHLGQQPNAKDDALALWTYRKDDWGKNCLKVTVRSFFHYQTGQRTADNPTSTLQQDPQCQELTKE